MSNNINIDFYNKNKDKLTKEYNSISFEQVHGSIIKELPKSGKILDIGCGSGRDAFALAKMGYKITAVDPATEMLEIAKKNHSHENITWKNDSMPHLKAVKNEKFDFILLSAVWMHVKEKDRKQALTNLKKMMKPNAKMIIYLRHGEFSDERVRNDVSVKEIEHLTDSLNIKTSLLSSPSNDVLKRSEVSWESVCVQNTPKIKQKLKRSARRI